MAILKWTGGGFRITQHLADKKLLQEWLAQEGSIVLEDTLKQTRVRWFFARSRARRALLRDARAALKPGERFATAVKRELDELPKLVRQIGVMIRRRKHRDLYTVDNTVSLVVVPRAVVRNEFAMYVVDKLLRAAALARFKGLPVKVLRAISAEAEQAFFEYISGGKHYLHRNGRAVIVGADAEFGWQMSNVNGHYYCGYSDAGERNLSNRRDFKNFSKDMKEVILGQTVHLNRLKSDQIQEIAQGFRTGQPVPVAPRG